MDQLSSVWTVGKQLLRRLTSMSNSAETATGHDATGNFPQANLPTGSTTYLQGNSGGNRSEWRKNEAEAERKFGSVASTEVVQSDSLVRYKTPLSKTSSDADDVRRAMSILSDLSQLRFDTTAQSELLPPIIELMKVQLENVQVLINCHRLIDRFSSDSHPMDKLESPLKRTLTAVLLSAVKCHSHHSLIVEKFCHLLWETIDDDNVRTDVDLYLGAISCLLEIVCDCDNMTTPAIKSAFVLIREIAVMCSDADRSELVGKLFVANVCRSMKHQLKKFDCDEVMEMSWECLWLSSGSQEILLNAGEAYLIQQSHKLDNSAYAEVVKIGWDCLDWIFSNSRRNERRFLDAGGIRLIQRCYRKFGTTNDQADLVSTMTWVMKNLSYEESLRADLMANGNLKFLWGVWRETKVEAISSSCAQIFADFVKVSPANWPSGYPARWEVQRKLRKKRGKRGENRAE